jgi:hypothetical protein
VSVGGPQDLRAGLLLHFKINWPRMYGVPFNGITHRTSPSAGGTGHESKRISGLCKSSGVSDGGAQPLISPNGFARTAEHQNSNAGDNSSRHVQCSLVFVLERSKWSDSYDHF